MSPTLYNFMGNRISKGNRKRRDVLKGKRQRGARSETARLMERAFTLIELLAVIAIIGLLAGIILATSGSAIAASRKARIKGEHSRLVTAIEDYKAVMANFPPDNQDTSYNLGNTNEYHTRCGKSPLFYELSGCTFENIGGAKGTFTTQNKGNSVPVTDLTSAFGVKGVDNSARNKKDIPYRGVSFKPSQFAEINGFESVDILIVPIDKGPFLIDAKAPGKKLNPWFYDASSTNRHNVETFDVWAEYLDRGRTNVIGNW